MTGLPTVTVKLDYGAGTWATDVTSKVRMKENVSVSGYGRTDEFSQPQGTSFTCVLDNTDGRFTNGTVVIEPTTTLIRVTEHLGATTVDRFTGRVSELSQAWPGGGQEFATVTVTATDLLADLARQQLRSMLEEEAALLSPTFYYPLSEGDGSTSAGDETNNHVPLTVAGSGAAIQFGQGTGPVDGASAVVLAGGKYLAPPSWVSTTFATFGCWFATTSTSGLALLVTDVFSIVLQTSGKLGVTDQAGTLLYTPSPVVNDGANHLVLVTASGSGIQVFIDGQNAAGVGSGNVPTTLAGVGNSSDFSATAFGNTFVGSISHVMGFAAVLTNTQVLTLYQAGAGFSETTDARLSRLASYAGLIATTDDPSGQIMGAQTTAGESLLDAMQNAVAAEAGVLFADGSGNLVMQGRSYRSIRTTADVTLGETEPGEDTVVTWDTQQKFNQVTVTRTGGAVQTVATAGVGARTEPVYPTSIELNVDADAASLDAANWILSKHQDTEPRIGAVTFDLLTSPNAEALLGLKVGDRLLLSAMPSQMWGTADYTVEGWAEATGSDQWTLTVNLLPFDLFKSGVWDDTNSMWDSAIWGY